MGNGCVSYPNRWNWQIKKPRYFHVSLTSARRRQRRRLRVGLSDVLRCANIEENGSTASVRDERSFFSLTLSAPTSANNRGTVSLRNNVYVDGRGVYSASVCHIYCNGLSAHFSAFLCQHSKPSFSIKPSIRAKSSLNPAVCAVTLRTDKVARIAGGFVV